MVPIPPWMRRGFPGRRDGGAPVLRDPLGVPAEPARPPPGSAQRIDGSLILVPALAALAVLAVCCPTFLAATRTEAVLGAVAGFLVAADLLMAVSFVSRQLIAVHWLSRSLPLGVVAALLAIPVAVVGIVIGPLASEHGFGHSSGLGAVLAGAVGARAGADGPVRRPRSARSSAGSRLRCRRGRGPVGPGASVHRRSRNEFVTTLTDEKAIAPAARAGSSVTPANG